MFIAMRLSLLISAKSEMLSISLFADEVRGDEVSINIPCLRHVLSQFVRAITFAAKPLGFFLRRHSLSPDRFQA